MIEGACSELPWFEDETDDGLVNWKLNFKLLVSDMSSPIATTIAILSMFKEE